METGPFNRSATPSRQQNQYYVKILICILHHNQTYGSIVVKYRVNLLTGGYCMIQLHIIVSGKVQGVGYRYFSQMKAVQYEVTGWVKNLSDNAVEITAIGTRDQLDPFIKDLRIGTPFSTIDNIEIIEQETVEKYHSFTIKY
jgi:acylphosphatase